MSEKPMRIGSLDARMSPLEARRIELRRQAESCLMNGAPHEINLQIPRHAVITPVLRSLVYDTRFRGKALPVVFTDGSHPPPFPVGSLVWEAGVPELGNSAQAGDVLKVGLMSMRHPEFDYLVDLYVSRNMELSRDDVSEGDKEALSYSRAEVLFFDSAFDRGGEIWVFHTGLEPMVVGFYRAAVHALRARRARKLPPLVIRPWIYSGRAKREARGYEADEEEAQPHYSPSSSGAQVASYEQLPGWA